MILEVAGSNIADSKTEYFMKSALQDIYKFEKSGRQNAEKVDQLLQEAEKLKAEERDSDSDSDVESTISSDYDSDDSVDAARRGFDIKSILKEGDGDSDGDDEGRDDPDEFTYDDFLEKVRERFIKEEEGKVEFDLDEDDKDEYIDYDALSSGLEVDSLSKLSPEEQMQLMQRDMWERNLIAAPRLDDGDETHRIAIMNFDVSLINVRP